MWEQLRHAYGAADDIPELLQDVIENPYERGDSWKEGVWFKLWSALCHQGDIYTASIAAVPHLVAGGLKAADGILDPSMIWLPVSIEDSRRKRPEQIQQAEIEDDYWEALQQLNEVCNLASARTTSPPLRKAIADARRFLRGRRRAPLPPQKEGSDLGELFRTRGRAEQDGGGQPATRPESKCSP